MRTNKYQTKDRKTELERRKRISQSMKGKEPSNLQLLHKLPRTKEWRRKIGLAHRGLKHTEETKRRISDTKRNPLTSLHKAVRECYKSRQWREAIFARDNFTCVLCKKRGGILNADHFPKRFVDTIRESNIKTVNEALDYKELWNINNGRTLCLKCHRQSETWGNKFKRTVKL